MKKLKDFIKYGIEKSDQCAIAQINAGQIVCNSLTVNHYFQIGSMVASCSKVKDLKETDQVLTLEVRK